MGYFHIMKKILLFALLFTISFITNAQTKEELQKILASDGSGGVGFGSSVSISGDKAIVGAMYDAKELGSAYIYNFEGSNWVKGAKLVASDGSRGDLFGYSVSISGDKAIVGTDGVSTYIFSFDGSRWVQSAKLVASDYNMADMFGRTVSISGDKAIVGACGDDDKGSESGSAYIFSFDGSSWVQSAKLLASDGDNTDYFGYSVSISGDKAIVGAKLSDDNGSYSGSAYIFSFDGSSWVQSAKLLASDGANSGNFGHSVSISGDKAIVGAPFDVDKGSSSGSAYIFSLDGSSWVQSAKLLASDGRSYYYFGWSVSISGDKAIVGSKGKYMSVKDPGLAYIFSLDGSSWVQSAKLLASDRAASDYFGYSVSISGDKAIVGAPFDVDKGSSSGSAYMFELKTQTIVFNSLSNATYGNEEILLTATANSGLDVEYSSDNTAVAEILEGVIHVVGSGTCNITASQFGNANYLPAGDVVQSFTVNQKTINISANANQTKVYGDTDPTLTYTSDALVGADTFSGEVSRAVGENIGNYAIAQNTLTAGANYDITFTGADFNISKKAIIVSVDENQTIVYGNAEPDLTYTSDVLVGDDAFSGEISRAVGENVGNYAIAQNTLTAGANYDITFTGSNFIISKKAIIVSVDANQEKIYKEDDTVLTYTADALVGTDTFTGELSRTVGENVGDYPISQNTLSAGANYNITFSSENFTITPKIVTVIVDANQTKAYGDAEPILTVNDGIDLNEGGFNDNNVIDGSSLRGKLARVEGESVGYYAITQGTVTVADNYEISFTGADFNISKKTISVSANANQSKVYGDAEPTLTYTADALVGDDNFSGEITRVTGEDVSTYAISKNTLTAGDNYEITFTETDFNITQKTITVAADANQTKAYGDAEPTLAYTADELISDDDFSGNLNRESGEEVGFYEINIGSLSAGNNYNLTFNKESFEITKSLSEKIFEESDISIYPNPTKSNLYISNDAENNLNIKVIDINGRVIIETSSDSNKIRLDMERYPSGVYNVVIEFEGNSVVKKILKK